MADPITIGAMLALAYGVSEVEHKSAEEKPKDTASNGSVPVAKTPTTTKPVSHANDDSGFNLTALSATAIVGALAAGTATYVGSLYNSSDPSLQGLAPVVGAGATVVGFAAGGAVASGAGFGSGASGVVSAAASGFLIPLLVVVVVTAVVIAEVLFIVSYVESENDRAMWLSHQAAIANLITQGKMWEAWDLAVKYSHDEGRGYGWRGGTHAEQIRTSDGKAYSVTQVLAACLAATDSQAKSWGYASAKDLFDQTCTQLQGNQPWVLPGYFAVLNSAAYKRFYPNAQAQWSADYAAFKAFANDPAAATLAAKQEAAHTKSTAQGSL